MSDATRTAATRSPGEEALREAARLETARVYGKTCPEHRAHTEPAPVAVVVPVKPRRLKVVS